jgi:hypothetical protein
MWIMRKYLSDMNGRSIEFYKRFFKQTKENNQEFLISNE